MLAHFQAERDTAENMAQTLKVKHQELVKLLETLDPSEPITDGAYENEYLCVLHDANRAEGTADGCLARAKKYDDWCRILSELMIRAADGLNHGGNEG